METNSEYGSDGTEYQRDDNNSDESIININYDLMNVDDRVKVIVLFLNEVYQHYGNDTENEITNIYDKVFSNNLPDYKTFFESIYKNKENTQALLKLESKFFELLKSDSFDDLQTYINSLYTFHSEHPNNLNRNFSIDTNSLENILQVMIYYDKNKLINFDDLKIKDDEILFTDQSLKDKIKQFPNLQSDFIKKHPKYKYIQDYINLHKTIDVFRTIYQGSNDIHYNDYKLNSPENILQIIDSIIKYSIKYFRLKIKNKTDIFDNLIVHFNYFFKDYDISKLFNPDQSIFKNWIIRFINLINEFVHTISENLIEKFSEDPGFFDDHYESEIEMIRNINDYNTSIATINSFIKQYNIYNFDPPLLLMEMHNFIEEYQKPPNNKTAEYIISNLCQRIQLHTNNGEKLDIIYKFLEKFINTIKKNKKRAKQHFELMMNTLTNTKLCNLLPQGHHEEYFTQANNMKTNIINLIGAKLSELQSSLPPQFLPLHETQQDGSSPSKQELENSILKHLREELKSLGNEPRPDSIRTYLSQQHNNNNISNPIRKNENQNYIDTYNEIIEKLKDQNDHNMMDRLLQTTSSPLISP